ncbi:SCF complex F-box protein MET30 [Balamuthia mandrillaris]
MNDATMATEESSSSSSFSRLDDRPLTSSTTIASSPSLGRNKSWSSRGTPAAPSLPASSNKQRRRRKLSLPSLFAPAHHLNKAANGTGSKDKVGAAYDFDDAEVKEAKAEQEAEQWQRPNRDEIERVEKEDGGKEQAKEKEKEKERLLIGHLLRRKHTKLKTPEEPIQGLDSGGTEGEPAACLANFPDELFLHILAYLGLEELGTIALVCRKLLVLSEDDSLWRGFCEHRWRNKTLAGSPSSSASSFGGPSPSPYNDGNVRTSWKRVYLYKSCVNKTWMSPTYRPGVTTLTGHKADVLKVRFNESLIVSGSKDRSIKMWNVHTGQCLRTLQGHRGNVYCVRFDDNRVVSCSQDQTIKVWDIETGKCMRTLRGHTDQVWCVRFDEESIVSGGFDHTLKIWDLHSKKCLSTLTGHTHYVYDLQFDKEKVVSCAAHPDNTIRIWDQRKGRCRNVLTGHSHYVYCLQYDHEKIKSGSGDQQIKIWDIQTGECTDTLQAHTSAVWAIQFDEDKIVSGSTDQSIRIWDIHTKKVVNTLHGHSESVATLQFDDEKIISGSADRTLKVWNFRGRRYRQRKNGREANERAVRSAWAAATAEGKPFCLELSGDDEDEEDEDEIVPSYQRSNFYIGGSSPSPFMHRYHYYRGGSGGGGGGEPPASFARSNEKKCVIC